MDITWVLELLLQNLQFKKNSKYIVVQSVSHVQLFATPWTAARQASLSFTVSRILLRLMSIELMMASNHLVLCHPLLLPSIFPIFSFELALPIRLPKYWSFSTSPSSEYSGIKHFFSFRHLRISCLRDVLSLPKYSSMPR